MPLGMTSPRTMKTDSWSNQGCMPAAFLYCVMSPSHTTLWWPWGYKTTTFQKTHLHTCRSISTQKNQQIKTKTHLIQNKFEIQWFDLHRVITTMEQHFVKCCVSCETQTKWRNKLTFCLVWLWTVTLSLRRQQHQ